VGAGRVSGERVRRGGGGKGKEKGTLERRDDSSSAEMKDGI
jgi:hypothetical protein